MWVSTCWYGKNERDSTPPWWRHQMETFSALLAICAGNSPVTGEFPSQRPVTRSFDIFFDLCPNKRLSNQSGGWWFETPLRSSWRHCNGYAITSICLWYIGMSVMASQTRSFVQQIVWTKNKEITKAPRCWPLLVASYHKGSVIRKVSPCMRTTWQHFNHLSANSAHVMIITLDQSTTHNIGITLDICRELSRYHELIWNITNWYHAAGSGVNYGISKTTVLEIPYFFHHVSDVMVIRVYNSIILVHM